MKETMTVNGKEYALLKLLGKGKGGYSWLAEADDGRAVTLKQIHHEPCDYYQFGDKLAAELADYRRLSEIGIPMPEMLDVDRENERIVKEYIEGETVYEMVLQDRLPETCLEQIRAMCRLLYPAHTNIDYFPTNFILQNGVLVRRRKEVLDAAFRQMVSETPAGTVCGGFAGSAASTKAPIS